MATQTKQRNTASTGKSVQDEVEEFKETMVRDNRGRPPLAPNPELEKYDYPKLLEDLQTKSNVIRFLASRKFSRTEIAKFTGLRYQHVRNVLLMPMTKSPSIASNDDDSKEE